MDRRTLLSLLAASAGLGAVPSWLRAQSADDEDCARAELAEALARARREVRPALVIVVPAEGNAAHERGELFGSLLTHGTDEQLAPLATCELACGSMADLRDVAGDRLDVASDAGEPLLLFFPAQPRSAAMRISAVLPDHGPPMPPDATWEQRQAAEVSEANARIAALAAVVSEVLGGSGSFVRSEVSAAEVRRRAGTASPPGARWARQSGCGPARDEDPITGRVGGFGCGMGHVPAKAERFLRFLAAPPRNGYLRRTR